MEPTSYSDLIARLRELAPFADDAGAGRALVATVGALTDFLTADERRALNAALAPTLRSNSPGSTPPGSATRADLFARVREREGLRAGLAVEHAEVVCRVLGEALPFEVRERLAHAVPALAQLFEPVAREALAPAEPFAARAPNDLAEGRVGSRHPLASSDPARLAHRHSVARSLDPHGDSKLSSAAGLTQERDGRSLATGAPGSERPLSHGR